MARKILSGVLAFTMIFGATAPMAMADEISVEQYALVDYQLSKSTVEYISGDVTPVLVSVSNYKNSVDSITVDTIETAAFKVTNMLENDGYLVITPKSDAVVGTYTVKVTVANKGTDNVVTNIELPITVTVKVNEAGITWGALNVEKDHTTNDLEVAVGATNSIKLVQNGVDGKGNAKTFDVAITNVEVHNDMKDKITASFSGNTITVTGKVSTDFAYTGGALRVTYTNANGKSAETMIDVAVAPQEDISYSWVTAPATSKADKIAYYMIQAYRYDEYGKKVPVDNSANFDWYINNQLVTVGGVPANNGKTGADKLDVAQLVAHNQYSREGAKGVEFFLPGTYTIAVKAHRTDNVLASTTVTVGVADVEAAAIGNYTGAKLQLGRAYNLNKVVDWNLNTTINGKTYYILDENRYGTTYAKGAGIMDDGYTLTAELAAGTETEKAAFNQFVSLKDGVLFIENNETTQKYYDKGLKVTLKVTSNANLKPSVTLNLDKFIDMPYVITVKDGKTDVTGKTITMKTGETKQLTATITDTSSNNTVGNVQDVVWMADDKDANQTNNVIVASVDQTGLITATAPGKVVIKVMATDAETKDVTIVVTGEEIKPTEKPTEAPDEDKTVRGYVNTQSGNLNVRAGAGTSYDKVGQVTKNTPVIILAEKDGWYNIQWNANKTGWVKASYIVITEGEVEKPETPAVVTAKVTASSLKVRKTANGTQIGSLKNGAKVVVLEKGAEWTKIEYGTGVAYVATAYLAF